MKDLVISLVITVLLCAAAGPARAVEGKFVPPEGKVLFFAGQNNEAIRSYVKTTGMVPAGLMIYTSVQKAEALYEPVDLGAGETYARELLDGFPNTALQIGLYMVGALEGIEMGEYDDNIDKIGTFIKNSKRPVFLRIGYEFDGPHNKYKPKIYARAYRYIVDRLRNNGVDNAAYVWHSYASYPMVRHMDWYPGDDYVDWFAISYFAQHPSEMLPMIKLAKEHNKPVMVAEATPSGIGTRSGLKAWNKWFLPYFDFIEKNDIKAFCYINFDWDALSMFADSKWKDCRIGSSGKIKKRWKKELSKDKYINASAGWFSLIGFDVPGEKQ